MRSQMSSLVGCVGEQRNAPSQMFGALERSVHNAPYQIETSCSEHETSCSKAQSRPSEAHR